MQFHMKNSNIFLGRGHSPSIDSTPSGEGTPPPHTLPFSAPSAPRCRRLRRRSLGALSAHTLLHTFRRLCPFDYAMCSVAQLLKVSAALVCDITVLAACFLRPCWRSRSGTPQQHQPTSTATYRCGTVREAFTRPALHCWHNSFQENRLRSTRLPLLGTCCPELTC